MTLSTATHRWGDRNAEQASSDPHDGGQGEQTDSDKRELRAVRGA